MKKNYKSNEAFLKDLLKHLEGDVKGFKEEIEDDKKLMKAAKSKKATPKMVKKHLKSDIKYYGKEAKQDKKILKKRLLSKRKKK